jgi:hypothetical protein
MAFVKARLPANAMSNTEAQRRRDPHAREAENARPAQHEAALRTGS